MTSFDEICEESSDINELDKEHGISSAMVSNNRYCMIGNIAVFI